MSTDEPRSPGQPERTCAVCGGVGSGPRCPVCDTAFAAPVSTAAHFGIVIATLVTILFAALFGIGWAVFAAIVTLPSLVRTMMVLEQRTKYGRATSESGALGMYLLSLFLTATLLGTLSFLAFWAFLFVICGGAGGAAIATMLVAVIVGLICGMVALARWRWRRDIDRE